MKQLLKNYLSTIWLILGTYVFYSSIKFYQDFFVGRFIFSFAPWVNFDIHQAFYSIITFYVIFLIPFYYIHKEKGKALLIFEYFFKKWDNRSYTISAPEKTAFLAWGVKIFFAPLMIFWILSHIFSLAWWVEIFLQTNKAGVSFLTLFNNSIFTICFNTILFIDVFFFTSGYLLESPYLKNTIRSVEPTIFGWAVTLACYPPFNSYVTNVVGWYSTDFPQFINPQVHITLNVCLLLLMAVYSWASLSLGFKASNLTNRGIVETGPYQYIRHPAYVAKNTAWWIGAIPIILLALGKEDYSLLVIVLFSLCAWTSIYTLRAMTEEWHLSNDKEYRIYKQKVRYRFIPKVW